MNPNSQKHPKTTSPPPKGNGEVARFENNHFLGGAGDAITSPRVTCGHTPSLSLGAVRGPACAPEGDKVSEPAKPVRILLSEAASQHLTDHGADAFVVVGRAPHPDGGRWVIHLLPATVKAIDAAVRVARGISKERRTKAPPAPPKITTTNTAPPA